MANHEKKTETMENLHEQCGVTSLLKWPPCNYYPLQSIPPLQLIAPNLYHCTIMFFIYIESSDDDVDDVGIVHDD